MDLQISLTDDSTSLLDPKAKCDKEQTPPLTVKNAIRYVKGLSLSSVLGEAFLELLNFSNGRFKKLKDLSISPDEKFKVYMTEWIEGDKEEEEEAEPSWRRLIWTLDVCEQVQADDIRRFAEPHKGNGTSCRHMCIYAFMLCACKFTVAI